MELKIVKMLKKIAQISFVFLSLVSATAQKSNTLQRPKLVVGLVVDQMRWDYLYRYYDKYQADGFKRMLGEGYSFNNVMIPYVPTITAIGHSTIYTGAVPSIHGIAGNNWVNRETGKSTYCTTDTSVKGVGSSSDKVGQHSPKNLLSTTITDQLRLATNFQSKVVGVSLKDRASILPAGHNPTAAFWFDEGTGGFTTSSYYMDKLPKFVDDFNAKKIGDKLVENGWNTLLPIEQYTESSRDDVPWESLLGSSKTPTFPYSNLAKDYQKKKGLIRTTPFGNSYTLAFAESVLEGYELGKDAVTDFLAINIASTDYVGHSFGPNSIEIQDTYLRLDRDLASFFKMLDQKVGKGEYLVFLSADHAGAHSEGFMIENKMHSGFYDDGLDKVLKEELVKKFGSDKLILAEDNYQLYLNFKEIEAKSLKADDVKEFIVDFLNKDPKILYAVDLKEVAESSIPEPVKSRIINGYNWERGGDIQMIPHDGLLPKYAKKGTTHGAWNSYDSHIPLIFMGWGIKNGESNKPYFMTDIAPTLAALLHIEFPSGTVGNPIVEAIGY